MGEYAIRKSDNVEVKIGTCESMYYLRADQRSQVRHLEGNVHPERDAHSIRFRFPFPDEDTIAPGDFNDHNRRAHVRGLSVDNLRAAGIDFDHGGGCLGLRGVGVVQQRLVKGQLVTVCQCEECGYAFRLPTLAEAGHVVRGFFAEVRHAIERKDFARAAFAPAMAERIIEGYTVGG
jgi:hypothetical protein